MKSLKISLVLILLVLAETLTWVSGAIASLSSCTTLNGNILSVPVILVGSPIETYISANFEVVSINPVDIELRSYQIITPSSLQKEESAYYSTNTQVLSLPCLNINNTSFWASFRLIDTSKLRFRLTGYGTGESGVLVPVVDPSSDIDFQNQARNHIEAIREKTFAAISNFNQVVFSPSTDPFVIESNLKYSINIINQMKEAAYNTAVFVYNEQSKSFRGGPSDFHIMDKDHIVDRLNKLVQALAKDHAIFNRTAIPISTYISSKGLGIVNDSTKAAVTKELLDIAVKVYDQADSMLTQCNTLLNYIGETKNNNTAFDEAAWWEMLRKTAVVANTGSKVTLWAGGTALAFAGLASSPVLSGLALGGAVTVGLANTIINVHDGFVEFFYDDPSLLWGPRCKILTYIDKGFGTVAILGSSLVEGVSGILTTYYDDIANLIGKSIHIDGTQLEATYVGLESLNPACANMFRSSYSGGACISDITYLLPPGNWRNPETGETFTINSSDLPGWLLEKIKSVSKAQAAQGSGTFRDISGYWELSYLDKYCESYKNGQLENSYTEESDYTYPPRPIMCKDQSCVVLNWCYFTFTPTDGVWTIAQDHWGGFDGHSLTDCHWISNKVFSCTENSKYVNTYADIHSELICKQEWRFKYVMDLPEGYEYEIDQEWLNDPNCQ